MADPGNGRFGAAWVNQLRAAIVGEGASDAGAGHKGPLTTVNSRRDVLGGWGWRPLYFLGFLRVIRSLFLTKNRWFLME
jgi:hypothetical protein